MTAPKPGDWVRVTYEAKWVDGQPVPSSCIGGTVEQEQAGLRFGFPATATVEVLASPVYVNHDTTEYRPGDVVRNADDPYDHRVWTHGPTFAFDPWATGFKHDAFYWQKREQLPARLTLLVRDGQVIA